VTVKVRISHEEASGERVLTVTVESPEDGRVQAQTTVRPGEHADCFVHAHQQIVVREQVEP